MERNSYEESINYNDFTPIDVELGNTNLGTLMENSNQENVLYMWGINWYSLLGDETEDNKYSRTPIDIDGNVAIGNENNIGYFNWWWNLLAVLDSGGGMNKFYLWVRNEFDQAMDFDDDGEIGNEKIVDVSLDDLHSSAILDNRHSRLWVYSKGAQPYSLMIWEMANAVQCR